MGIEQDVLLEHNTKRFSNTGLQAQQNRPSAAHQLGAYIPCGTVAAVSQVSIIFKPTNTQTTLTPLLLCLQIIENCEERLQESDLEQLLAMVQQYLKS